ncbi:TonB-dependent hemoglobin/transferrin/lactoferrin family receptor [Proteus hauseri]|uniref:TonB-dependent hemoglobin/transferrin/lactoferrin family receptor n=1 Tax=Proteus hauseri TaxID=183417 RepID=UPI0010095A2D|nr:TonB-dependent hemoglobin/transferrin/lactoferrin family receptor [Proteus hauseri]QAV23981.1 TonB-dependent receptor [Proteus hauseri]
MIHLSAKKPAYHWGIGVFSSSAIALLLTSLTSLNSYAGENTKPEKVISATSATQMQTEQQREKIVIEPIYVGGELNSSVDAGSTVLTLKDINRIQPNNIAELVDKLPGISSSGSPRPGGQTLNIWGMGNPEDIKITLDGTPKTFEKYRQGSIFIDPELIRRLDVDKGPHNITQGNGGFGGSVRIETKDPDDLLLPNQNIGMFLKYGHHTNDKQNRYSGAVYGKLLDGKADGLFYFNRRESDDLRRPDGTKFGYSQSDQDSFLIKTNLYLTDEQTLTLSASRSESDGWTPWAAKRDELAKPSQGDVDKYGFDAAMKRKLVYRDQKDDTFSAKWNIQPVDSDLINLTLTYGYSKTKQNDSRPETASSYFSGSMGNQSWVNYRNHQIEIKNESTLMHGAFEHQVMIGTRWHRNDRDVLMFTRDKAKNPNYNYGYYAPPYMPEGTQTTTSFYLQDSISYKTLTITPGVRYDIVKNQGKGSRAIVYQDPNPYFGHDYSDVTYSGATPHLGLLWKMNQNIRFFSDLTYTWRAPLIDEQYEVQSSISSLTGTSRHLDKETIRAFRIGAIADFENVFQQQDQVQLRTTLFDSHGKDEIFRRRGVYCESQKVDGHNGNCPPSIGNYRNLPGYHIQGMEIEAFYDSSNLFGRLAYSTMKGTRDQSPRDPWFGQKTWIAEIQPDALHATIGIKVPQINVNMGWMGDFIGAQRRSPMDNDPDAAYWSLPKSKGYSIHGLFANWEPTFIHNTEVRFTVANLFNQDYYPYLGESVSGVGRDFRFTVVKRF